MNEVPGANPVASPAAEMVATAGVADAQVTWPVRSSVVLSEKVPMAVNDSVVPSVMLGLAGVTAIDCRIAGPTVSNAWPVTPSKVALMEEVPAVNPAATPVAEMVATAGVADAQVTWFVRSSVELSEKVPVAVNDPIPPLATLGLAGVTMIDCRTAGLTVNNARPVTPPSVAEIVDAPAANGAATPAALMVATDVFADAQITWPVRSSVEPSEKVPVAVNGSVSPLATLGLAGVTTIDCTAAGPTSAPPGRSRHRAPR